MQWHKTAVSWFGTAAQKNKAGSQPKTLQQCMVTAHLYAEWNFIGKDGGAQGCCQLLWHGSTEEQGRQLTLNTAAVHWCMVTASLYAGLAQQQRRTRQAVNPKHCSSALVYGDCTPFQGRQLTLNTAAVHLCLVSAHLFAVSIFIGVNAVAQGCCQLVWHSSTEEQGRQSTQNIAAVHWCMVTAHLYAEWIFIGVNAVAQGCCQLVWHSNREEQGRQLTLNTAVHWCLGLHTCMQSGTS